MNNKNTDVKPSPREVLMAKDLVGFETRDEGEQTTAKTGVTKSGKSMPGKALQPSWARG